MARTASGRRGRRGGAFRIAMLNAKKVNKNKILNEVFLVASSGSIKGVEEGVSRNGKKRFFDRVVLCTRRRERRPGREGLLERIGRRICSPQRIIIASGQELALTQVLQRRADVRRV